MKLLRILLICSIPFMLSSCFSQKIILNADKNSGTLYLDFEFDDDDFEVISLVLSYIPTGDDIPPVDPSILISQDELDSYLESLPLKDIKVKKATVTKKAKNTISSYNGSIVIEFANLEKMLSTLPIAENGFKLTKDGGITSFAQSLDFSTMPDFETLESFIELIKEDKPVWHKKFLNSKFSIQVQTKTPMIKAKGVVLSPNKKSATYTFLAKDMVGDSKKKLDFLLAF